MGRRWWSRVTVATGGAAAVALATEGGIVVAGGTIIAVGKVATEVAKRIG